MSIIYTYLSSYYLRLLLQVLLRLWVQILFSACSFFEFRKRNVIQAHSDESNVLLATIVREMILKDMEPQLYNNSNLPILTLAPNSLSGKASCHRIAGSLVYARGADYEEVTESVVDGLGY